MRTLTSTLTAAGKSPARSPYVRVRVQRKIGAAGRLDWERIYTGVETEALTGLTQAGDGSILRIRVNAGNVEIQRTATPSAASAWSTWPAGSTNSATGIAICARGAAAAAFYTRASNGEIYACTSADYGATWTAWALIDAAGALPYHLAAAINPAGDLFLAYERGATVHALKKPSGAAWNAPAAGPTLTAVHGLAVHYLGDWNLIITGLATTTADPTVWTDIYGDGYAYAVDTWGDLYVIQTASAGSGVTFRYPSLAMPDVYRLSFRQAFTGTTAYNRPYLTHSLPSADFVSSNWRDPVPFNYEPALWGLRLAYTTGDYVYAATHAWVWRAPLVTGAGLDLSSAVTALKTSVGLSGGSASVRLDNSAGAYASPGAGALLELQRGSILTIDPGYNTASGAEASSPGPTYWIESLTYSQSRGKGDLLIEAIDAWGLLDRWHARSQVSFAGTASIAGILTWVLARVGLETALAGSNSSALSNQYPAFTIHPDESAATAALRLLALIPDRIGFRGTTGYLLQPVSTTDSLYSYGGAHPILEGQYAIASHRQNHVQVTDSSRYSESFTWAEIALVYNRTATVHDVNLTSAAEGLARADAELRAAEIAARADVITVPAHAGQELLDVIDITVATAGLSAARRRVIKIELEYNPAKAIYQHTLTLGDP